MATTIPSVTALKNYLTGVLDRAGHHALNVNDIVLALIGGVIWKATTEIAVWSYDGAPGNILWLNVNGQKYCFRYNHTSGEIEVCKDHHKGTVLRTFSNATPLADVRSFFESL